MTSATIQESLGHKDVATMMNLYLSPESRQPRGQDSRRTHSEKRDSIYTGPHIQ
jgi:hypothetical protein